MIYYSELLDMIFVWDGFRYYGKTVIMSPNWDTKLIKSLKLKKIGAL